MKVSDVATLVGSGDMRRRGLADGRRTLAVNALAAAYARRSMVEEWQATALEDGSSGFQDVTVPGRPAAFAGT